ncbi:uncharacterized protein LOC110434065 [Sorghum bicolor]|uniref:uncharacterized protein LOC110434065 n=1 Tax=Sorghum bicolor TaxID=4558 RepID=UPI000B425ED5|nr:uncharacterized protein LOC110434065 [Sorghum bicolor]|eukprot:XP_021313402.1 uncharacterized protein LOC110434065 [Sorghum bicolor]
MRTERELKHNAVNQARKRMMHLAKDPLIPLVQGAVGFCGSNRLILESLPRLPSCLCCCSCLHNISLSPLEERTQIGMHGSHCMRPFRHFMTGYEHDMIGRLDPPN